MNDATQAFWLHQLTRGKRMTPRACEEAIQKRPHRLRANDDERIRVMTDPAAVVRVITLGTNSDSGRAPSAAHLWRNL